MTKRKVGVGRLRGAPLLRLPTTPSPAGSRVLVKSRFRRYSLSLLAARLRFFVAIALSPRLEECDLSERLSCRSLPRRLAIPGSVLGKGSRGHRCRRGPLRVGQRNERHSAEDDDRGDEHARRERLARTPP